MRLEDRRSDEWGERLGIPAALRPLVAALQRFRAATAIETMDLWLQLDLSMPQFAALHAIWRSGRMSGRELAGQLRVSPAAVVKVCDRLESRGYIERVRDRADRRVQWLQLTDDGAAVFQRFVHVTRQHLAPALGSLPPSDQASLARILNELAAAIEHRR
jgi:DNA-binding MarR family transcriptional regulator